MSVVASIVQYNVGNIYSLTKAMESQGFRTRLVSSGDDILASDLVILPGVGAYLTAMKQLKECGLDTALRQYASSGKGLLGICLGMQLLFNSSEENGGVAGLGILKGAVCRFPQGSLYRVPQIQWNKVKLRGASHILNGIQNEEYFYFLHSYYVTHIEPSTVVGLTKYCDIEYCSTVQKDNIWATQFHPEKSGPAGLKLLANFMKLGEKNVDR